MSNKTEKIFELAKEGLKKFEDIVEQEVKPEIPVIEATSENIIKDVVKDVVTELSHGEVPTIQSLAQDVAKDTRREVFTTDLTTKPSN
ncbi:MAG: hypothetical protein WAQ98_12715 [Blastocatellia bacterium]